MFYSKFCLKAKIPFTSLNSSKYKLHIRPKPTSIPGLPGALVTEVKVQTGKVGDYFISESFMFLSADPKTLSLTHHG